MCRLRRWGYRSIKLLLVTVLVLLTLFNITDICKAESSVTGTESSNSDKDTSQSAMDYYDYSEVEHALDNMEGLEFRQSFEELVKQIISGESDNSGSLFDKILDVIFGVVAANKDAVLQIIILAILAAAINAILPTVDGGQVADYARMIIEISLITILAASFFSACNECVNTIDNCIAIYKSLIPVFFSAVVVTTGNVTAAAYYDVVLMMITVVNAFYKNVFVNMVKMYVLLIIADLVTGKEQFSKMCELIQSCIKIGCKAIIAIFAGIGGLKGLINPMADSMKKNVVLKGLKLVPVVGGSMDAVSGTLIGAGAIIKNGIGTAAIVVLVTVCMIPVLRLTMIAVLFKVTAAVIEPIAGKRMVKVVNGTSVAVGLLTLINIVVLTLFILMIAIICISTNVYQA